jgi:uncharacterized protein (TIGR02268 family)
MRFKDGAAPASAAFWLVVYAGKVEPLVEVYRESRTVESYQQEVQEKDAQIRQCQKDYEQMHAEQQGPRGFAGLLATGLMDKKGIAPKDLSDSIGEHPANSFALRAAYSYRSTSRVAVELELDPPKDLQSWRAVRAELVGPGRRTLRVNPAWQSDPVSFDTKSKRVVIEGDAAEAETRGSFTLKLWNEDGTRSVILSGVTFP